MDYGVLNEIPQQIRELGTSIEGPLAEFALRGMAVLLSIQLAWGIGDMLLRQSVIHDFSAWFVRQIIQASFFAGAVGSWSMINDWMFNTFRNAANQAGDFDVQMTPSAILATGGNLANDLVAAASLWDMYSWVVVLLGLMMVGCFVVMALITTLVWAEAYLVTAGNVAKMAYAGSGWTLPMALSQLRYMAGTAAKLFLLTFLLGMFHQMAVGWVETFNGGEAVLRDVIVALALSLFGASMIWALPTMMQALVTGANVGYGGAAVAAGMFAASNMAKLGGAIADGIKNGIGTAKLASEAKQAAITSGAGSGKEGIARTAEIGKAAIGGMVSAMAQSVGGKSAGTVAKHSSLPWNARHNLRRANEQVAREQEQTREKGMQALQQRRDDAAKSSQRQVSSHVRAMQQEKRDAVQQARLTDNSGVARRLQQDRRREQQDAERKSQKPWRGNK